MRKLIALLLAAGAVAGAVLFWRRNQRSWAAWCSADDSACSWGKAATDKAGEAADTVSGAAEGAADAASSVADELSRA
jgi:hypothetical protein